MKSNGKFILNELPTPRLRSFRCIKWCMFVILPLLPACELIAPKVNETRFSIENPLDHRVIVQEKVALMARDLGFSDNTETFKLALDPWFRTNVMANYVRGAKRSSRYFISVEPCLRESLLFWDDDVKDLPALAVRLNNASEADKVSRYLWGRLSPATQNLLSHYTGGKDDPGLRHALALDLDKVAQCEECIYDPQRFAGVRLSAGALDELRSHLKSRNCYRLNRILVEDAYPEAISRHSSKELLQVSLTHRNITGRKPSGYLEIESRLTDELTSAVGSALRVETITGWVP